MGHPFLKTLRDSALTDSSRVEAILFVVVGLTTARLLFIILKKTWEYRQSNAAGRLLAFLCSIADRYEPGNNLYQYLLIGPRAYHILHPKNVEALLSTNFADYGFGCRPAVFAPLLGNGIFTQEGAVWKHSRELFRKQLIRAQYQDLRYFHEHVGNLIDCMPAHGVVDLQPLFFNLTWDGGGGAGPLAPRLCVLSLGDAMLRGRFVPA
ncbi:uncharacterized protein B0T15DRAFT_572645 [Chaetomium strumarium]|uniref:Cytochrome P450 n=1 Tax=Chaetomium strumarium TaxID=1170767 RepID=A0AAJ0M4H3_9PEZI|nr:hypothetical protein B0T15DRAFT_572645 [Chaetomium strumarium]